MANDNTSPRIDVLRSPLGRARGLGSAKAGSVQWWGQNLASAALVPLSLWFVCAMIRLLGASRQDVVNWISGPAPVVLMIALVLATFYHMQLGLQVVIEDYVHVPGWRLIGLLAVKAAAVLMAVACIVAILRLGL